MISLRRKMDCRVASAPLRKPPSRPAQVIICHPAVIVPICWLAAIVVPSICQTMTAGVVLFSSSKSVRYYGALNYRYYGNYGDSALN
jgi:hypothetical protein